MISSQKGREFVNSKYNHIKRVYSIWVCMNMSQNCMNYIHFTQESVVGTYQWKGDIDLANIVLIGLAEDLPEKEERYELHRLLGALLSAKLNVDEKFDIIGNEFDIPLESDIRKDVNDMCNLSQGIVDDTEMKIVINMYKNNFTLEQISLATKKSIAEIERIINENSIALPQK